MLSANSIKKTKETDKTEGLNTHPVNGVWSGRQVAWALWLSTCMPACLTVFGLSSLVCEVEVSSVPPHSLAAEIKLQHAWDNAQQKEATGPAFKAQPEERPRP